MTFLRTAVGAATFAAAAAILGALAFGAPTGSVRVKATTGRPPKPVPFVIVSLYGPENVRGVTGASGAALFNGLAPGTYRLVTSAKGYLTGSAPAVTVVAGRTTTVAITLRRFVPTGAMPTFTTPPHLIAVVSATPKPQVSPDVVDENAPAAMLSNSLLSALATLPGVVLQGDGVSIDGHPASQTQATIDGVPVAGSVSNLSLFGSNIFSEIGVDGRTSTLGFATRGPTLDWLGHLKEVQGSHDTAQFSMTEGGTLGRVGLSATHASGQSAGPLDGMRFLDTSGLDYVHDALTRASANTLTIRMPFSTANVLTASATEMRSSTPSVCTEYTGPVPCGYGPYDRTASSLYTAQLHDAFSAGPASGTLTLYSSVDDDSRNGSGIYVNGVATPQFGSSLSRRTGLNADWSLEVTPEFTLRFNVQTSSQRSSSTLSAANRYTVFANPNESMFSASLDAPIVASKRFSSDVYISTSAQNGFSATQARLDANYRVTNVDTLTLSMEGGGTLAPPTAATIAFVPSDVSFDCAAHNALGIGPPSSTNDTTTSTQTLSWNHAGGKLSNAFSLSRQVSRNAPVDGIVAASAFASNLFPADFLSTLNSAAQGACGSSAPYALSDVYYQTQGIADRAVYDGAHETLSLTPTPFLQAQLALGLTSARAYGTQLPLFSQQSTVAPGRQLPDRPYATASLSMAGVVGRGGTTLLAVAQYTSKNNFENLPAFTVLNAGVEMPLARGEIVASVLNIANQYPGPFATSANAQPIAMPSGEYRPVAYPLAPRTFEVAYQVQIGSNPESLSARREANASRYLPYDVAGPRDPLAIDRQSEQCGPESLPLLGPVDDAIRAYERRIEAARTAEGYPASFPEMDAGMAQLNYRPNGASYVILIGNHKFTRAALDAYFEYMQAVLGCQTQHTGTVSQARRAGLYVPSYDEETRLDAFFKFAPGYGLYTVPSLVEEPALQLAPYPEAAPAKPFALNDSTQCDASRRGGAQAFLDAFSRYANAFFAGRTTPALPDGITASPESAPHAFLMVNGTGDLLRQIEPCLVIHGVTLAQVGPLGVSVAHPGDLEYAPRLGFYTLMGSRSTP